MKEKIIMHIDMNSYFASVEQQANPFLRGRPVGVCAYLSPGGCIIASSMEAKAKGVKTGFRVRDAKQLCPDIFLVENEPAKYRSTTEKIFNILDDYSDKIEHYSIDEAFLDLTGWADERILRIRHPELWDSPESLVVSRESNAQKACHSREGGNPGEMDKNKKHIDGLNIKGHSFKDVFITAHSWIPDQAGDDNNNNNDDFYWAKVISLIVRDRVKKEVGEWMNCSIGVSYTKFLAKFASDIAPKKGILIIRNYES
jgi:nucleotidyltransferase/DNA polymerase involved in DNA repair